MSELRKMIAKVVREGQGMKLTELIVVIVPMAHDAVIVSTGEQILEIIEDMITKEELVAVRYVLPEMTYREKMFVLPKFTELKGGTNV